MDYKAVTNCRVCKSRNLTPYLSLGNLPLANLLLNNIKERVERYPLDVLFCNDCALSQLSIVVNPHILYDHYPYYSSVSETFRKHCEGLAKTMKSMARIPERPEWLFPEINWEEKWFPTVLDIASNDNCLLKECQKLGMGVLGCEPATNFDMEKVLMDKLSSHSMSADDLIPNFNKFFSYETACEIASSTIRPMWNHSFITAQNVLAHVDDLHDFLKGVHFLLDDNGVFIAEFPHAKNLIENNEFDTIYHEHLSYFLLKPLIFLFVECGLKIFKVEKLPIHGGSLRIYASKRVDEVDKSVEEVLNEEEELGLYDLITYKNFARHVEDVKIHLKELLKSLRYQGAKVMAYGASAKGSTLMNYCGLDFIDIHSIVDETPSKIGKFTAVSKIPIVNKNHFYLEQPDYILLTAWNFKDEMIEKTKEIGAKYIVPIPRVEII